MLKNIHIVIVLSCISLFSCTNSKKKDHDIALVKGFYKELNKSNYMEISKLIGDSMTISEGDYDTNFSKDDYYRFFQWDSVFAPTYQIVEIKENNGRVEAKISQLCTRIQFLNQKPIVSKEIIEIKNNKISSIKIIEQDSDFTLWNTNKNKIVSWIKKNHPQLDGFIYDQTKKGALNYLKAIALYKESEKLKQKSFK